MGCFGYICNGCGKAIRGDELAVLKHIRHGKVLGEATGYYDSYGKVDGNDNYRNDDKGNINSHFEICKSEFDFYDSEGYRGKIYEGKPIDWMQFRAIKGMDNLSDEMYEEWRLLPQYVPEKIASGTEVWHKYCYDRASEEDKERHIPSEGDSNQSWGKPRKKYM